MSDNKLTIIEQDELAIANLAEAGADMNAPRTINHYLYVPNRKVANGIADELRRRGFRVEVRLGADGSNWLVLASHEAILTEPMLSSTRHSMEALITQFGGGDYDGWDADVQPRKDHAKPN